MLKWRPWGTGELCGAERSLWSAKTSRTTPILQERQITEEKKKENISREVGEHERVVLPSASYCLNPCCFAPLIALSYSSMVSSKPWTMLYSELRGEEQGDVDEISLEKIASEFSISATLEASAFNRWTLCSKFALWRITIRNKPYSNRKKTKQKQNII